MHSAIFQMTRSILFPQASAQIFNGPDTGLQDGLALIRGAIGGVFQGTLKEIIVKVIIVVLDLVGIVAVGMIILAGVYLITGQGEEDSKTKAKNILIWTIAGLAVILLSRAIFGFVLGFLSSVV